MWQPPGGLSGPPEHNNGNEDPPEHHPPLNTTPSSQEHSNSQFADARDILHVASGTRVTRGVLPRNRGLKRPNGDRANPGLRQANTSQNNVPPHGSSWVSKQTRCSDEPSRRHFRMANLYDIQYTSSNLIHSIPNEVISNVNDEDASQRLLSKRQNQGSAIDQSNTERPNENLAVWTPKDRFSTPNEDFNMISTFSRSQTITAGISQCSSDSSTESGIPDLFHACISNTASMTDYSAAMSNNTMSCSNSPTEIGSFPITESINGNVSSGVLVCSDSFNSDTISAEMTSANLYGIERSFNRTHDGVVMLELQKLNGPPNLNLPPSTVQTRKVANRVITHTRIYKTPDERFMLCLNCDRIPTLPVTGQCGHTRCSKCVKENDTCPCGVMAPRSPSVNTVVQAIIDKMLQQESGTRSVMNIAAPTKEMNRRKHATTYAVSTRPCNRMLRSPTGFISTKKYSTVATAEGRLPMTPQGRLKRARELLACGQYRDAVPQLARVAASSASSARLARSLLAQAISALSQNRDPRRLTRELYKTIRLQSAGSWLKASDLECVLCYHTYTNPVTTPCGHTYCRTCIERSLDYRKKCALCLRQLDDFNLAATRETEFVSAALAAIDAVSSPTPPDPDVIPIFVCTVAFPSIPCPLFIFDPRYWLMIRRILESGSRKFGMVAYERDRSYSDYGTVLEVCDCVHLEDGRSILSTVGVSRFRVIERDVRDGCDVARIQPLVDLTPNEDMVWELRMMATQISYKALVWLETMNRAVRAEIEAAFGAMPHFHSREDWWEQVDGPQWLWWLIAILPLRSEIKILILSTRSLLKRMMAVSRTLEVMDSVAFTNNTNTECDLGTALSSTEDWLERSA